MYWSMAVDPTGLWQGGGMAPFDTSQVSPSDAIATLRSLRRRFADAFSRAESPDDLSTPKSGGLSPIGHAQWTARALRTIEAALRNVEMHDNPTVELPPTDPDGALPPVDAGTALADLAASAESLADAMAGLHGDDWARTGQGATGKISALDLARLGVQIAVDHLRAVERIVGAGQDDESD
jgi:hypothetical protein